jgi:hypothetical protein
MAGNEKRRGKFVMRGNRTPISRETFPENWQTNRTMSPGEYRRTIAQLGLNTALAGRWLGIGTRTAYRYRDGESEIPEAHVLLLRAAVRYDIKPVVPPWIPPRQPPVAEHLTPATA